MYVYIYIKVIKEKTKKELNFWLELSAFQPFLDSHIYSYNQMNTFLHCKIILVFLCILNWKSYKNHHKEKTTC